MDHATPTIDQVNPRDTPDWLRTALGDERASRWLSDREPYRPEVSMLTGEPGEHGTAAALTSGRPHTRYTKIVDLWSRSETAAEQLLDHLISASLARGDAGLKWEVPTGELLPAFAARHNFSALRSPIPSADGTEGVDGFVHWHSPWPHAQLTFYGQTTEFTCGAVAAMTALTQLGLHPFGTEGGLPARERELLFWRLATNFPACEPIGLAVAMHDELQQRAGSRVEVYLDAEGPVLLEGFEGEDRQYRELLQAESVRSAAEKNIPLHRTRIEVADVMARVAGGDFALLLIDEAIMHAASVPHWVVAHAVQGDTTLIHDPWVTAAKGETWVDSHDLPVSSATLDTLLAYGDPAYRGVIFVTP